MSALSIRIPDDLKIKVVHLAAKKNMSFNALVNHWLHVAILQDETIEWMKRRLKGKDPELLILEFGLFLKKTKPGLEPRLDEIEGAMKD